MNTDQCQNCGAPLAEDARGGLCSSCLFAAARTPLPSGDAGPSDSLPDPGAEPQANVDDAPALPRRFADYELLEEIARGGMGVVFKARQISLDRIVALKLLLGGALSSPEFVKRFRLEAAAAGGLQHPNIVAIHEVGLHEGQHFIAMDYVDGPNLATVLAHGPLPARRAVGYLKTVAEAIEYAHSKGILHRDLKPSNILLDANDQPHVTDFGLAKKLESDVDLTVTGQVLGSPNYMPPEQASGQRGNLNRTADVYSLGAILYHLLTGRPPFQATTLATTLEQVRTDDPIAPRRLNASLPRDLETICLKCLEKEPERRYPTAQTLADEINRFLNSEPIQARPIGALGKSWRWCRRKPALATVGAIAALLLLTLAIGGPILAIQQTRLRADAEAALNASRHSPAQALQSRGVTLGALAILERAVNRFPEEPQLWNVKGLLLEQLGRTEEAVHDLTRAIELMKTDPHRMETDMNEALLARCRVLKSLGRFLQAGRDFCRANGIPLRDASAPPTLIDLSLFYRAPLTKSLHSVYKEELEDNLAEVPQGLQEFAGVQFDVRGVVALNGDELGRMKPRVEFPQAVTNIPVGLKFARLQCFMGTGWAEKDGVQIGTFVLRYNDGRSEELPICYGIHVRDVLAQPTLPDDDNPLEHGAVIWRGMNDVARQKLGHLRLYLATWNNPHPGEKVSSVDFVSTMTPCAPFLVAMTVEP